MNKNKKITLFLALVFCPIAHGQVMIIPDVSMKSKISLTQKNATESTFSISHDELNTAPVVNFSDYLKEQQSAVRIASSSSDSSQTAISLRGFGDNAVANALILIDGFPLTNPSLLNPNLNSIPLADIERVDIFQGSAGTLYGNQAVGGVINIITKHPRKFFGNLEIDAGSYYLNNIVALFGNHNPNGMYAKTFSVVGKTENYRDHNRVENNNIATMIGFDYDRGTASLNVQTYSVDTDFPGGLSLEQFKQNPQQARDHSSYAKYRTTLLQLLNKHEFNPIFLETRLEHTSTKGDGKIFINFTREDSTTSLKQKLKIDYNKHKLLFGYDALTSHFNLENLKANTIANSNELDIYLQDVIALTPQVDFTVGARSATQINNVDGNHSINRALVSEQTLSFHPAPEWQIYLRRDGNFRLPKANENSWLPPGQKSLQTQTGVSYETGLQWHHRDIETNVNLFHLVLNNEIAFNPEQTEALPFGAFNNLTQTTRNGLSIFVNDQVNSKLKLNTQINYVDARFSGGSLAGNLIPAVPALTANAGLIYQWNEHWITQYNALFTGARFASADVTNVAPRLHSYWLHNISLQYFKKPYTLSFQIDNLFNQSYANYAYYNPATLINTYYPAMARSFLITAKIDID